MNDANAVTVRWFRPPGRWRPVPRAGGGDEVVVVGEFVTACACIQVQDEGIGFAGVGRQGRIAGAVDRERSGRKARLKFFQLRESPGGGPTAKCGGRRNRLSMNLAKQVLHGSVSRNGLTSLGRC